MCIRDRLSTSLAQAKTRGLVEADVPTSCRHSSAHFSIEKGLSLTDKSKHRFGEQFMNHADPEITIQHAAFYAENSYLWLETL